jgi:hypothetical protein
MNNCNCGKKISLYAKRCNSCENKRRHELGIINSHLNNFKGGIQIRKRYCETCEKELNITAVYKNTKKCQACYLKTIKGKNHPLYGKHHSKKSKNKISMTRIKNGNSKGRKNGMFGKIAKHGKGAYYKNVYMRSSYEIAYAKYLDKNNIKWLYEYKTFDLGYTTYTPDFYLPETDTYVEIKGWWRPDAKKKFRLFKKLYSKVKIEILTKNKLKLLYILK